MISPILWVANHPNEAVKGILQKQAEAVEKQTKPTRSKKEQQKNHLLLPLFISRITLKNQE